MLLWVTGPVVPSPGPNPDTLIREGTTERKLTSVNSCYEESPPCQLVGFCWGRDTQNIRLNYGDSVSGRERERERERERRG